MNWGKKTAFLFLLAAFSALQSPAQVNTNNTDAPGAFDMTGFPQWTKDLRRWEIVAFGSIPFAMFTATFAMDMYRWNNANGFDFSDEGRRYAPWPLKSAGAEVMESKQYETVFVIAGSLSFAVAMADLVIVQIKRYRERKRVEALPAGTAIIIKKPWGDEPSEEQDDSDAAVDEDAEQP